MLKENGSHPSPRIAQERRLCSDTKGCVFDIKRYAIHDGPGIRTTVFFKGCPLHCQWCHNPESWRRDPEHSLRRGRCIRCGRCVDICKVGAISLVENQPVTDASICRLCGECIDACVTGAREMVGREMTVSEVMAEVEKDVIFYDQSSGGVTFSGGEPLMQPEFLLALLDQCRGQGIRTAVDTSCYAEPDIVKRVSERTGLFLCDLKHIDSDTHERFTGVGNGLILDNLRRLSEAGNKIIIRIPVIPGFNDEQPNIEASGKLVASLQNVVRIDLLPYNRGGNEKLTRLMADMELMQTETPSEDKMNSITESLGSYGFEVKIGG